MVLWVVTLLVSTTIVDAASNMIFKKIDVQMGAVGSDDDIRIKICDNSKCCTTKELSNTFSSEWKAGKLETWDGGDLGNCSSILFDDKLATVEVSIVKELSKKDALEVTSMVLSGQVGSDKKNIQKFKCGNYKFSNKDSIKSNFCSNEKTAPRTTKRPAAPATTKKPSRTQSSGNLPNLQIKKLIVQVGATGTDDDVTMQICDLAKCCTTSKLSHTLSSEWVKNKQETWDGRKLGNCSDILFKSDSTSLEVAVIKTIKKKQPLEITSIVLEATPTNDKKKIEKFKCGQFKFGATDTRKVTKCLSEKSNSLTRTTQKPAASLADLENYKINNVVVQMGDDGTNDDISLEICNAKSALTCCDTGKLSGLLSNDWSKNDKETWKNKDLGQCKTKPFNACRGFDVAVKKKSGKDSLKVKDITLELVDTKDAKKTQKFVCSNYNVGPTDTVKRNTCVPQTNVNCPKNLPPTTKRTTKKPPTTTGNGPCLRSGKNCGPPSGNVILQEFFVEVGRDGTRDTVKAKVCGPDQKECCNTQDLKKRTGNNWVRNGNETWNGTLLGDCKDKQFPTKTRTTVTNLLETKLILSLSKNGKDGMKLKNFNINAVSANGGQARIFKCGKIEVLDSNKATAVCTAKYAKKEARTTKKPKTTTRPPFRSTGG